MTKRDFVIFAEEIRNMLDPVQRLNAAAAVAAALTFRSFIPLVALFEVENGYHEGLSHDGRRIGLGCY